MINLMFLFLPLVVGFGTPILIYNFTLAQASLNNVWVSYQLAVNSNLKTYFVRKSWIDKAHKKYTV